MLRVYLNIVSAPANHIHKPLFSIEKVKALILSPQYLTRKENNNNNAG